MTMPTHDSSPEASIPEGSAVILDFDPTGFESGPEDIVAPDTFLPSSDLLPNHRQERDASCVPEDLILKINNLPQIIKNIERLYEWTRNGRNKRALERQPNRTGTFRAFFNYWIKPPKNASLFRRPTTIRDVQLEAGQIGGGVFGDDGVHSQAFFWLPDDLHSPKLGEWVYMKYLPDKKGNVQSVVSHIHYPITRNNSSGISIKKYYGHDDVSGRTDYRHRELDEEEIRHLLYSAEEFTRRLVSQWTVPQ